ncbi:MAG: hypothetical protein Q8909_01670 [Bacteroidota bacterium]|nr:hypothetical protein [Bacteroidota bacterium]
MNQRPQISYLGKIKRPKTKNKLLNIILSILTIPLYVVIIPISILVLVFIGLVSFLQRLTSTKENINRSDKFNSETDIEKWSTFTSTKEIIIKQKPAGSLPWNSGDYLYLKSEPEITYLNDKYFGDWLLVDFEGIFLQKWNSIEKITCDLIFIDYKSYDVIILKENIPSRFWKTEKLHSEQIQFTFTTTENELNYIVHIKEINERNIK